MGKLESKIRTTIKDTLNRRPGCKFVVNHGNQYAEAGNPDISGCCLGQAFVFEVKNEEGQISKIQNVRLQEWAEAGAICGVVRDVKEAVGIVETGHGNYVLHANRG